MVICQDATVGVFSFTQVLLTIHSLLPLNDKTICLTLPLLYENGVQLELDIVDFLLLPPSERKDVIVERSAAVGADIEVLAMLLYLFHYLF